MKNKNKEMITLPFKYYHNHTPVPSFEHVKDLLRYEINKVCDEYKKSKHIHIKLGNINSCEVKIGEYYITIKKDYNKIDKKRILNEFLGEIDI